MNTVSRESTAPCGCRGGEVSLLCDTVRTKDTTTQVGPRAHGAGTPREALAVERTRRLMPTIGDPSDAAHAEAMSRTDGCPNCVLNHEPPQTAERDGDGWLMTYWCTDCGHQWSTTWGRLYFDWSL